MTCPTCQGAQEIETGQRESDTGYALTCLCPQCDGEGAVEPETFPCDCCSEENCNCGPDFCVDCDKCLAHCICEDQYAEADRKFTEAYENDTEVDHPVGMTLWYFSGYLCGIATWCHQ